MKKEEPFTRSLQYKFQGMSQEEQWDKVKKAALCKNCLKLGHIVSKSHAPPMCKKCTKHRHTLLHIKDDPFMEVKNNVCKDVTYVAASRKSEEVLLMTC